MDTLQRQAEQSDEVRLERRAHHVRTIVEATQIDEEMVRRLVHAFYEKMRTDALLAPIFTAVIGENWDAHLAKMCDFWSSVMLRTGRYKGNPMIAHLRLKAARPHHFERWLALFAETAKEQCPPAAAELFIARADNIARSLQLGMFYRPGGTVTGIARTDYGV